MPDYLLAAAVILSIAVAVSVGWTRLAGTPASRFRAASRVALALALGLATAGVGAYSLSKSRSFQLAGELVSRVDTAEKVVALTFDDGPTREYTRQVLQTLAEKDVIATFYLTGAECEQNPSELRAIVEAGHELGNHTYSHRRMVFTSTETARKEIERTDSIFESAGYQGKTTFRPPGCKRLLTTPLYLAGNDRTTVTWDVEPDSVGAAASAEQLTEAVAREVRPGSIVLMHVMYESRQQSRDAVPKVIDRLQAEGYRFVTVSELTAMELPQR